MNSELIKKLLILVVCTIALKVGEYGIQSYREHQSVIKVEEVYGQLKTDAIQKHPDAPVSVALEEEFTEQTAKMIDSKTDDLSRSKLAADMFWGYFFYNVKARPEFCREQGVDIQSFITAFKISHISELAKAQSIYGKLFADENEAYTLLKPQARKIII